MMCEVCTSEDVCECIIKRVCLCIERHGDGAPMNHAREYVESFVLLLFSAQFICLFTQISLGTDADFDKLSAMRAATETICGGRR